VVECQKDGKTITRTWRTVQNVMLDKHFMQWCHSCCREPLHVVSMAFAHLCDILVANENVSLVISRQILTEFCSYFSSLPDSVGKEVAHFTLDKVQPRVVSFEEQVTTVSCLDSVEL